MRKHSPLPEGYSVQEAVSLRLFNAQGKLVEEAVGGPDAVSQLEARAWKDAWEQIDRELREDLRALREGIRPLEDLRRLRQYMRMLDAIEQTPSLAQQQAAQAKVVRARAIGGLALAAAAAVVAVVIGVGPFGRIGGDYGAAPADQAPAVVNVAGMPKKPSAEPAGQSVRGLTAPRTSSVVIRQPDGRGPRRPFRMSRAGAGRSGYALARTPLSGYAVSFGEFATRTTAEGRMRLIRAKGYIVYVAEVGDTYLVITRPYRTRAQADRLANALQEIGLPAMTQIAATLML